MAVAVKSIASPQAVLRDDDLSETSLKSLCGEIPAVVAALDPEARNGP